MAERNYKIGDKVILSEEGRMNDNYKGFFNKTLIIDWFDEHDTGLGE